MNKENAKYCQSCGFKNAATVKFCGECGKHLDKPESDIEKDTISTEKGLGIVSLVTAILGFTCLPGIGLIIAIITGYLTPNANENSYAKAGASIGVFTLATALLGCSLTALIMFAIDSSGGISIPPFVWILIILGIILSSLGLVFHIRWLRKKPTT